MEGATGAPSEEGAAGFVPAPVLGGGDGAGSGADAEDAGAGSGSGAGADAGAEAGSGAEDGLPGLGAGDERVGNSRSGST